MQIIISNYSDVPIYEQIKSQIKTAIIAQKIKAGELLPSMRQLAKDLQVSVITTSRAYKELEEEGLVALVQGKGCYVLPQNPQLLQEETLRNVEDCFSKAINMARLVGISAKDLKELLNLLMEEENYE